ncbi:MAG: hypothetical protein WDW36_005320 [Sanguina aurantia]
MRRCAVKAVQEAYPACKVLIYAREGVTEEQLVKEAKDRFNVHIEQPFQVVPLALSHLLHPERYPRFTLLRQAIASARVGYEALSKVVPEVYIDTTGWAFPYPLAWAAGSRVAAYVHYPFISPDMLSRVWNRTTLGDETDIIESPLKSLAKLLYYCIMSLVYGCCGAFSSVNMVNSSWTQAHIRNVWLASPEPVLVYPPADTTELQQLPLDRKLKRLFLVSVNQFRPEKNHRLQLQAYAMARDQAGPNASGAAVRASRLVLVGGCRNDADAARIAELQSYAADLGVGASVEWAVNCPYPEMKALLGGAVGGLHTMVDEHFGISVVEYMAAGVIPIAHNSGGPRADIVVPLLSEDGGEQITGFLATSVAEYAEAITTVLAMDQRDRLTLAAAAQKQAARFSTERFMASFKTAVGPLMDQTQA